MWRNENGNSQPPEKSNFTRRCSLLSRYLKEKGSFGNIDLGLVRKPDSDLRLSSNADPPGKQSENQNKADSEIKALHLFQRVSKGEPSTSSGVRATKHCSEPEPASSQLTIFFGGKVLVYNDFPADKATEIMEAAKHAKPMTQINIQTQINNDNNNKNNIVLPDLNEPTNSADTNQQQQQQVERIARRASLHRFFAKRKGRAVARAPYQANQNSSGGHHHYPPKPESSQPPDSGVAETVSHPKPGVYKDMLMEVEEEGQCSKSLELRL